MYKDKIEYLKRVIKRNYKRYTGERNDGEATLKDVTDLFNIPVDESRLDDYIIKNIDYKIPAIEVLDKETNTIYRSKYTCDADLLNYSAPGSVKFISVQSFNNNYNTDSIYYIGDNKAIMETITFKKDKYYLTFEKESFHNLGLFSTRGNKVTIRFSQDFMVDNKQKNQLLFNKIFDSSMDSNDSFEQKFTYGMYNYINAKGKYDKYTYVVNNNVICGNNEYETNDLKKIMRSVCFEDARCELKDYFPMNMYINNFPDIGDYDSDSLMLFSGFIDHFINRLAIYKCNGFFIKYNYETNLSNDEKNRDNTVIDNSMYVPMKTAGKITSEEIDILIDYILLEYPNNEFINLAIEDLKCFKNKIDENNKEKERDEDLLDPKLFLDKSIAEIADLIASDKDNYFSLIKQQFNNAAGIVCEDNKCAVKK